ncbi:hypothetical protein HA052_04375 [Chromobacterium haemolyticum]|uniref:Uncharacterized protein n=1 Tax=Chromobacterium fluminis TaxID=3044269 RepID=A0ABX0L034_9NEIS|nr:hypothetical protein [Chromobacterium haemolyticum]NHR04426.1 hypothetical protein [Chromobacterium haemolyticum]
MKQIYRGFRVGNKVTSLVPVRATGSGLNGRPLSTFEPGMQGKVLKINSWFSRPRNTVGQYYFVLEYYSGEQRWEVTLKADQIAKLSHR